MPVAGRPLPIPCAPRALPICLTLLASLWLAAAVPAGAQSVGLAVQPSLGGYYRGGRWVPVNCALTNQGPPADVRISAQIRDYGQNYLLHTYEISTALPSPANRRYTLYVMPAGAFTALPLKVELIQDRRVVAQQEQVLRALNPEDRLIAVIAPQEGGFGGLAGTRLPARARAPGYGSNSPNQGQVQVAYVKPELVPDHAIGYQIADLVVLSGVPSGSLSPAQEKAITRWVQAGGTLLVTGGADPSALQTPAMRTLLPVEVTGTIPLLGREVSSTLRAPSFLTGPGSLMVPGSQPSRLPAAAFIAIASRPRSGAETVQVRAGVPLLAWWRFGAGRVVFLAADPGRPPFLGWDGLTGLWLALLRAPSPATPYLAAIDEASQSGPGRYSPYGRQPLLSNACLQVSQLDVPSFAFIGLFLLSYIVVLVPVNYLVLKRRDRRELAWLTTPAIVLAFSGLAYLVGYGTKGGQVVLAQAGVVEVWAGSGVQAFRRSGVQGGRSEPLITERLNAAPALTYFGLFAPRKTQYDLAAGDGAVPLMPAEPNDGSSRRQLRVVEGDGFALKDVSIDMWDMGLFRGDSVVELGDGLQSDLKQVDGRLVGRITNRMPFDLEGVTLLTGGSAEHWGTLRRGQTRAVASPWSPLAATAVLPRAVLPSVQGTSAPARMRRAIIEPLTTWNPANFGGPAWMPPDHPMLLGWVSRPLVPAQVDGHPVRSQAAHLFLIHLPLK
jgi:hypothetical protein